jgi:CPA2 family monovalent cation:H+ antiporter-2
MADHGLGLVFTLTGGLGAALALGLLARRLGLSPIVGYLLAGIVVGPHTPGFVADGSLAGQLAEVGVVLLMFGVGLHFRVQEILAVRWIAVPGAVVQMLVATGLTALVARSAGWSWAEATVLGLSVSVASTVVMMRVLAEGGALDSPAGHLAVGWLVVEDLAVILALVLLPELASRGGIAGAATALGLALLKLGALAALTAVVGRRFIPWLLARVDATGSRELFTLTVLVLALGLAVGAARLFGASPALGAFLAGVVVGQSDLAARAAADVLPMRDAFAVLFFVSVGMLLDPGELRTGAALTAAVLAVILVGKPLAAIAVVRLLGRPMSLALPVGAALSQIGELSFVVAAEARALGLLPPRASQIVVAASIASISLSPLVFRGAQALTRRHTDDGASAS